MARAWHLMRRPQGMPVAENFALKDLDCPSLATAWCVSATAGCRSTRTCAGG